MREVDYDKLDPGIRACVRALNLAGFETADSGDGVSKAAQGLVPGEDFITRPHVVIKVPDDYVHQTVAAFVQWVELLGLDLAALEVSVAPYLHDGPTPRPPKVRTPRVRSLLFIMGDALLNIVFDESAMAMFRAMDRICPPAIVAPGMTPEEVQAWMVKFEEALKSGGHMPPVLPMPEAGPHLVAPGSPEHAQIETTIEQISASWLVETLLGHDFELSAYIPLEIESNGQLQRVRRATLQLLCAPAELSSEADRLQQVLTALSIEHQAIRGYYAPAEPQFATISLVGAVEQWPEIPMPTIDSIRVGFEPAEPESEELLAAASAFAADADVALGLSEFSADEVAETIERVKYSLGSAADALVLEPKPEANPTLVPEEAAALAAERDHFLRTVFSEPDMQPLPPAQALWEPATLKDPGAELSESKNPIVRALVDLTPEQVRARLERPKDEPAELVTREIVPPLELKAGDVAMVEIRTSDREATFRYWQDKHGQHRSDLIASMAVPASLIGCSPGMPDGVHEAVPTEEQRRRYERYLSGEEQNPLELLIGEDGRADLHLDDGTVLKNAKVLAYSTSEPTTFGDPAQSHAKIGRTRAGYVIYLPAELADAKPGEEQP